MAKVLVVDDDLDSREVLHLLIERGGHEVEVAVDGREAMEKMKNGLRPHIILLDIAMGQHSAFAFRDQQLQHPELAAIPVIVQSGLYNVAGAAAELGAAAYFEKPFDPSRVLDAIRICTASSQR